jgi:hypothetical protein
VSAPGRLATALAAAAGLAAAPCAAAATPARLDANAKQVADAFARALVLRHDLATARAYASARFAALRRLRDGFAREGVDTIVGPSRILRGCRLRPAERPSARGDCVDFRVRGRRRTAAAERRSEGDFRVWLRREPAGWKVWAYRYAARVTICPGTCAA